MTKHKTGLVLFWIAIIWVIFWALVGSIFASSAFRNLTMEELNQTMWAVSGPWFLIWGIFGVPLGAIIAVIGILLYSEAKGVTALKYAVGLLLALLVIMFKGVLGHIPALFGIGGTLILLLFIGIIWLWAKERKDLKDIAAIAADFRLLGYAFMLIAAWFICGMAGFPFLKAFEGIPPSSPLHIMILLVLGWFFLFLSHYKSQKQ